MRQQNGPGGPAGPEEPREKLALWFCSFSVTLRFSHLLSLHFSFFPAQTDSQIYFSLSLRWSIENESPKLVYNHFIFTLNFLIALWFRISVLLYLSIVSSVFVNDTNFYFKIANSEITSSIILWIFNWKWFIELSLKFIYCNMWNSSLLRFSFVFVSLSLKIFRINKILMHTFQIQKGLSNSKFSKKRNFILITV